MNYNSKLSEKGFGSEIEQVIKAVKNNFKAIVSKRKDSILLLGNALEKVLKPDSVCEEIKIILADEIRQDIISRRAIERYCLPKWKKKTKPKNDKMSFSAKEEMAAAMANSGNTVCIAPDKSQEPIEESKLSAIQKEKDSTMEVTRASSYDGSDQKLVEFVITIPFRELKIHMIRQRNISSEREPILIFVTIDLRNNKVKSFSLGKKSEQN